MASISSSGTDLISITVQISSKGSDATVDLNNIPSSMTIGELKTKLNVRPNSRFGRLNQFENWDNQRPLSDYFVKNGESFDCVIQSVIEDEQRSSDDYDEWLLANQRSVLNKINDGSIEDDKLNKMEKIVDHMLAVIDFYNNQQTLSSSSPSPPIIRQHEQEKEQEQINNTLSNDDHRETRTSPSKDH
ncbi:unnamed protein product [Rotaria sp. Silwood1]|nr:unnamed protein product [Rotaria sp. Silwood1]